MTKSEFVESIAGDFASKKAAGDAVESILDGIADTLAGGGEVNFTGFGKFSVAERGPRQGVNPRTQEQITIPGGKVSRSGAARSVSESTRTRPRCRRGLARARATPRPRPRRRRSWPDRAS